MNNNVAALEDAIKASTLAPNYPQVNFNFLYIFPLNCDNLVLTYYNTLSWNISNFQSEFFGKKKKKKKFEFWQAYICKGDALMAMEQYDAAGDSYSMALHLDPSIRRSKSFKVSTPSLHCFLVTTAKLSGWVDVKQVFAH